MNIVLIKINSFIFIFSTNFFFDFNGYTLMAIGIGITFGIKLPENSMPHTLVINIDFGKNGT